jgi:hypothetical protein
VAYRAPSFTQNYVKVRDGLGVFKYKNGRKYEGNWRHGKRDGLGIETLENGN